MRTVILIPDEEVGGYTVEVPSLPGCVTEGDTVEEALANARDAIDVYIAALHDLGRSVPPEDAQSMVEGVPVLVTQM
jgi:predicted RNase H-like HicB family nuclease